MSPQTGKYLVFAGLAIVGLGLIIYLFPNAFKWFGRLPGDIRIERENFKLYFPIVTMILLSLLFTLIINIFRRL